VQGSVSPSSVAVSGPFVFGPFGPFVFGPFGPFVFGPFVFVVPFVPFVPRVFVLVGLILLWLVALNLIAWRLLVPVTFLIFVNFFKKITKPATTTQYLT
jgi:hypothetical protein